MMGKNNILYPQSTVDMKHINCGISMVCCSKSNSLIHKTKIKYFRHNDLPWNIRQFIHNKLDKVNLSTNIQFSSPWSTSKWSHTDLYRMRKGMVGCQLWTAYAPCGSQHKDAVQITLEQIDLIKRLVDLYPDYLQLVHTSQGTNSAATPQQLLTIFSRNC